MFPYLGGRSRSASGSTRLVQPNMRLKLAGARVGRIALPPRPASLSAVLPPCASGDCARSLSAIR